jgi:hypothetical protein
VSTIAQVKAAALAINERTLSNGLNVVSLRVVLAQWFRSTFDITWTKFGVINADELELSKNNLQK